MKVIYVLACNKADPSLCFRVPNASPHEVEAVGDAEVDAHQHQRLHDVDQGEYQPPPALLSTAALIQFQMLGVLPCRRDGCTLSNCLSL